MFDWETVWYLFRQKEFVLQKKKNLSPISKTLLDMFDTRRVCLLGNRSCQLPRYDVLKNTTSPTSLAYHVSNIIINIFLYWKTPEKITLAYLTSKNCGLGFEPNNSS